MLRIITTFINDLNLKIRMHTIHKSDYRIKRLKFKLKVEEDYCKSLMIDTNEFCKKISSKNK